MTEIRCKLVPGGLYRHYKGKIAQVIGIASYSYPIQFIDFTVWYNVKSTDEYFGEHKVLPIARDADGNLRFCNSSYPYKEPLVIYSCSGDIWARPLGEFTGVINDPTKANSSVCYRFTEIPANYWDSPAPKKDLGAIGDALIEFEK